jgi:hypothetical protein
VQKRLTSLRPFTEHRDKTKFCAYCGNIATQEASFKVDGASLIEKYCYLCKENKIERLLVRLSVQPLICNTISKKALVSWLLSKSD